MHCRYSKLNTFKSSGFVNIFTFGAVIGTLVVVVVLPLSWKMDDGEAVENGSGDGGGGSGGVGGVGGGGGGGGGGGRG
jgi:hypothetical protein